ncbi:hypothetical protein NDU88_004618 [Pleurodeles waltl]|uniref:TBC1 domain-containing protein n=1 Tax=Pleurodeles waltl TaxID=8319 RepID=A0AAV7M7M4_PLEWA|nr:hypothetical protein NDU88_004618 [Pleurodeles waltl]
MDINQLEEEYLCIKQKQKLQTHIIVYKTGEDEPLTTEALVTTVPVNKKVQKPKAFEERIPVRGVTLEILGDAASQDPIDPWHIHLDIHRLIWPTGFTNMSRAASQDNERGNLKLADKVSPNFEGRGGLRNDVGRGRD